MSQDFYQTKILPFAPIIIKICRAYTNSNEDFNDFYQEVCLQIWKSRDNFKGQSEWSTWIYRLSLNVCLSLVRDEEKQQRAFNSAEINPVETGLSYSQEQFTQLYTAIKKLSKIDRAIILLYLEERPYKEIAEILNTTSNNIGVKVSRIKNRLKKLLENE